MLIVEDKIRVAHKIDELGVKYIEGGWPGSNDRDEQFLKNKIKDGKSKIQLLVALKQISNAMMIQIYNHF